VKNLSCPTFFVAYHKIENYVIGEDQKYLGQFTKNYTIFTQKLSLGSQKYRFVIRDSEKPIPDPGSATMLFSDLKSPAKFVCNWSAAPLMQTYRR
jgi:hypothetical protein